MTIPDTAFKEIFWPAVPGSSAATKLAVQFQLKQSQWWLPAALLEQQLEQFSNVLSHAYNTVPFYKNFYQSQSFRPKKLLTEKLFSTIPIITREHIQQAGDNFVSTQIPTHHGKVYDISTSGSTGKSIKLKSTDITQFFWNAFTFRDHLWHKRDVSKKLAIIKLNGNKNALPPKGLEYKSWGKCTGEIKKPGQVGMLCVRSSIDEQWQWLKKQNPNSILTYPSTLKALVDKSKQEGYKLPNLCDVSTLGEIMTDEVRLEVLSSWGLPVYDMYSCQEAGYLALQCPDFDHYHVQSENVILEVLNKENMPCAIGEVGRVVITTLHNFASPLIRYDIGDYAEVGEPCACGRGLPVLKRIVGRVRNLITYPDGSQAWPVVGSDHYIDICNVKQFQFIQKTLNDIEVKLVIDDDFTDEQVFKLKKLMLESLRYPFKLEFTFHKNIPRSIGGKFEDFISLL